MIWQSDQHTGSNKPQIPGLPYAQLRGKQYSMLRLPAGLQIAVLPCSVIQCDWCKAVV